MVKPSKPDEFYTYRQAWHQKPWVLPGEFSLF